MRAGIAVLAVSLLSAGVADAASKKKKSTRSASSVSRTTTSSSGWKRGYADIVIDANTGRVLHQDNADTVLHPASITKVMTLYLLFEQLDARKLRLDSQLKVSSYAARQQPSKLGVKAGSTIEVEDAIQALVTRSANDVAVVIAENISGSVPEFARLMTRRAHQLGMTRTNYVNPNGLPDQRQVTTARDLATLGRAIQERFPSYYGYFEKRSFQYRGVAIRNHNRLLGRVEGVDGIKTGDTNASGFNLLTSVKRDGRYVIAVVLGGKSGASRDNRMVALLSDALPRAYSGRQMVARMNRAPVDADDLPTPAVVAVAAPKPLAPPAIAPEEVPVPLANPRLAMASAAGEMPSSEDEEVAVVEEDQLTTASVPVPLAAPTRPAVVASASADNPAVGSVAPIVPVTVKTVAVVARPSKPTASFSNQPGILGTLAFSSAQSDGPSVKNAPAQKAIKPVQVASVGQVEIPRQDAEAAEKTVTPRSGWAIQIGAFGSEADARAQIAKAQQKVPSALAKVDPYTEEATKGSTRFVRARFAGFDAESAARKACMALKRQDFGCMVFRN
ncbi:D-alanyl-D-alanine carboxypeptidase [Ancylobacter pratisalsi]|uniref:D-alanyl-D-alanine carboxypeptidase n=1 Tax=Ancylobacter pratisalsi TaxID=1745854 RepID=UPI001FED0811|nr:D-alanyl-D-alanine carboxypeptidase [Ancylobacter pratisalsi]